MNKAELLTAMGTIVAYTVYSIVNYIFGVVALLWIVGQFHNPGSGDYGPEAALLVIWTIVWAIVTLWTIDYWLEQESG